MNFKNFNTHNDSHENSFEAFGSQLFKSYVLREFSANLHETHIVNGSGGDGGVEAFAVLKDSSKVGFQAKYFDKALGNSQFSQIKKSLETALSIHPTIKEYVIAIPRDFSPPKNSKGNKKTVNSEFDKASTFKSYCKSTYPNIKVHFWTRSILLEQIQHPENRGAYTFWFSNNSLDLFNLKESFKYSQRGWLSNKYIPNLHKTGKIFRQLSWLTKDRIFHKNMISMSINIITDLDKGIIAIDDFLSIVDNDNFDHEQLKLFKLNFEEFKKHLNTIIVKSKKGENLKRIDCKEVKLYDQILELRKVQKKVAPRFRHLYSNLASILKIVHNIHVEQHLRQIEKIAVNSNLMIIGKAGSGKSAGIAHFVENYLNQGCPAIVIRASQIKEFSWQSILNKSLGLKIHSLTNLLAFLQSFCLHLQKGMSDLEVSFLICVDGIDESSNITEWFNLIKQSNKIYEDHPWIKFAFSYRSSDFLLASKYNCSQCYIDDSNVSISDLIPIYYKDYNVKLPEDHWITRSIHNPLALRLFCEASSGKDEDQISTKFSLSSLINNQVYSISQELNGIELNLVKDIYLKVVSSTLGTSISNKKIRDITNENSYSHKNIQRVLDKLIDYSILVREEIESKDGISPSTIIYHLSSKSYYDYAQALLYYGEMSKNNWEFPKTLNLNEDTNIVDLLSQIILEEENLLIGIDFGISALTTDQKSYYIPKTLSQLSYDSLESYHSHIIKYFQKNIKGRNEILREIIIPRSRDTSLVHEIVHKVLSSYETVYDRDLFWSGPPYYDESKFDNVGTLLLSTTLEPNDHFEAMPLLFAWALCSLNTNYRNYGSQQLFKWGLKNIDSFTNLLSLIFFKDPQICADLSDVLASIVCQINNKQSLKSIRNWISENRIKFHDIFDARVLSNLKLVCNYLISLNLIDTNFVDQLFITPSLSEYTINYPIPNLTKGENGVIGNDLEWYVLDKGYKHIFKKEGPFSNSKKVLAHYSKKLSYAFEPFSFAVAFCLSYMDGIGWKYLGQNSSTKATHGEISSLCTFEEKYVWSAVYNLSGFLAIHSLDSSLKKSSIDFLNFTRTFTYYSRTNRTLKDFYEPYKIASNLEWNDDLKESIRAWTNLKTLPRFEFFLEMKLKEHSNKNSELEWIILNQYTSFAEFSNICRISFHSVCCFYSGDNFEEFISYIATNYKKTYPQFDRVENLFTYPVLPEINSVLHDFNSQIDDSDNSDISFGNGTVVPAVKSISTISLIGDENSYSAPSTFLRNKLKLSIFDGVNYINNKSEIILKSLYKGENFKDQQTLLLLDKKSFNNLIENYNLKPFWVFFEFRGTTTKLKTENQKFHSQNCRLWLLYNDLNGSLCHLLYHDDWFT